MNLSETYHAVSGTKLSEDTHKHLGTIFFDLQKEDQEVIPAEVVVAAWPIVVHVVKYLKYLEEQEKPTPPALVVAV